jgi:hypothetical protein
MKNCAALRPITEHLKGMKSESNEPIVEKVVLQGKVLII